MRHENVFYTLLWLAAGLAAAWLGYEIVRLLRL
jgi:hypothetical protein